MISCCHLGRLRGGKHSAMRLDVQGLSEMHEERLGQKGEPNGQHGLQCQAEPVKTRVGAGEAIDPPVPDPHRGNVPDPGGRFRRLRRDRGRHRPAAIPADRKFPDGRLILRVAQQGSPPTDTRDLRERPDGSGRPWSPALWAHGPRDRPRVVSGPNSPRVNLAAENAAARPGSAGSSLSVRRENLPLAGGQFHLVSPVSVAPARTRSTGKTPESTHLRTQLMA